MYCPGLEHDPLPADEAQRDEHHVVRDPVEALDACGVHAEGLLAHRRALLVLDLDVGQRGRAAEQELAFRALFCGERALEIVATVDLAREQRRLAHAAAAGAAFEGQGDAGAQARVEQRLAGAHADRLVPGVHRECHRRLAGALRRQPGREQEQQRHAADHRPHRHRRPAVDERVDAEIEPVELERLRVAQEIGLALAEGRLEQRQDHQHDGARDHDRAGRQGLRARHALGVHPQHREHPQRDADVQELQQREEAVGDRLREHEVAHQHCRGTAAGRRTTPRSR